MTAGKQFFGGSLGRSSVGLLRLESTIVWRVRPIARLELFFVVAHLAARRTMRDFSRGTLSTVQQFQNSAFRSDFLQFELG